MMQALRLHHRVFALRTFPKSVRSPLLAIQQDFPSSPTPPNSVYHQRSIIQQRQQSTSSGGSSATENAPGKETNDGSKDGQKKKGKIRSIIAQYGKLGLGLYTVSYLGTLIPAYVVFRVNSNFGLDLLQVLDYLNIKERVSSFFGYETPQDMELKPWQVSAVFAYIVGDVTEIVRIPAVLALCPVVHRKLYNTAESQDSKSEETNTKDSEQSHNVSKENQS